jgi:lysophospholipase L1-like esterase
MVVTSAALPCLVAEAVLRLIAPPPDTPGLFIATDSATEYIGRPGARGVVSGAPVIFNQSGLRDRDHAVQKSAGVVRIVVLGDSMTFGVGVPEPQTFPRVTEHLLNQAPARSATVEVLNFGIPGYNTLQELTEFRELAEPLQPDIVVVGFLYNDLEMSPDQRRHLEQRHSSSQVGQADPHERLMRTGPTSDASSSPAIAARVNAAMSVAKRHSLFLSWLMPRLAVLVRPIGVLRGVGLLGDVNGQFVDANPEWRRVQSELLDLKRLCEAQNARLIVMIIPAMTKFEEHVYPIKPYHQAVSRFCAISSITCLDLLSSFWGMNGTGMWISPTDAHPNAQGHRIIAEALTEFLEPIVTAAARRHSADHS